jgi:hypothetical protein
MCAISATEIGFYKKIPRFILSAGKGKHGGKSAWLFKLDNDNNHFFIDKIVYQNPEESAYNNLLKNEGSERYLPGNFKKEEWKRKINELKKIDKNSDGFKLRKNDLISKRLDYGSDIGILSNLKNVEGEVIIDLKKDCAMHDDSYLKNIQIVDKSYFELRSAIIMPIINNSIILAVLAIYSPIPREFARIDFVEIRWYREFLKLFLKLNGT